MEYLSKAAGCYRLVPFMSPYPEFEKVVSTVEDMFATLVYMALPSSTLASDLCCRFC